MGELKLTTEQLFKLAVFEKDVEKLNEEAAKKYLIELLRHSMVKDNLYKQMLKEL